MSEAASNIIPCCSLASTAISASSMQTPSLGGCTKDKAAPGHPGLVSPHPAPLTREGGGWLGSLQGIRGEVPSAEGSSCLVCRHLSEDGALALDTPASWIAKITAQIGSLNFKSKAVEVFAPSIRSNSSESDPKWEVTGEAAELEQTEHTGLGCKAPFQFIHSRPSEPCVWESATCSAARLRSRAVWHTRAPALALSWYSHTNWTQSSVCFWGNVFLSHLTSDLKSIRFPPPFLLEVHESQSRQTNESPGQFLVKRASLGGSSVIKCERGWLCW